MKTYRVQITDVTAGKEILVAEYVVDVQSGKICDALKLGTLVGAEELQKSVREA